MTIFYQVSLRYKNRVNSASRTEIGYIITDGKNVLKKRESDSQYIVAEHGSHIYSGDSVLTFNDVATVELAMIDQSVILLPNSEVVIRKKGRGVEVLVEKGNLNLSSGFKENVKNSKLVKIFKKNENGEYENYFPLNKFATDQGPIIITQVGQYFKNRKPQLLISWKAENKKDDLWIELWLGHDLNQMSLYKVYPYELGYLNEAVQSEQFFWQLKLRKLDQVAGSTNINFWKNGHFNQVHALYPNIDEVINESIDFSNILLKWSKSDNIFGSRVEIYSDEQLTQKVEEFKLAYENEIAFKPTSYGRYYWKVSSYDGQHESEVRSFTFVPRVDLEDELISWDEISEEKQYYYFDSLLHLVWKNKYAYQPNKYKVSLMYYVKNENSGAEEVKQENIFTDEPELKFLLKATSPIQVIIQAYNYKMERLGRPIERMFELVKRNKKHGLTFSAHEKTKKKDIISDREAQVSVDCASIGNDFEYSFEMISREGIPFRKGTIEKGKKLNFTGLPAGNYQMNVVLHRTNLRNSVKSQYLDESPKRTAASDVKLIYGYKIKVIPPVDYNIEGNSQLIKPVVNDVYIKE